jgi:hypothetical protein
MLSMPCQQRYFSRSNSTGTTATWSRTAGGLCEQEVRQADVTLGRPAQHCEQVFDVVVEVAVTGDAIDEAAEAVAARIISDKDEACKHAIGIVDDSGCKRSR